MKKQLVQVKKNLKSFILDDDAKVIDKAATKVAITSAFMALTILGNSNNAHAWDHSNHTNHQNNLNAPENGATQIHAGNNPLNIGVNDVPEKSVLSAHSNHYNHNNDDGYELASPSTWFSGSYIEMQWKAIAGSSLFLNALQQDVHDYFEENNIEDLITGTPYIVPEEILKELDEDN